MPLKYNAHAHCFTLKHVPENFFLAFGPLGKLLKISKLRKKDSINNFFVWLITRNWVIRLVAVFSKMRAGDLRRLKGLLSFEHEQEQSGMVNILNKVYGDEFGFVLLSMDMDAMGADKAEAPYLEQLDEMRKLKADPVYGNKVFPFVFADPRRTNVNKLVEEYINHPTAPFSGIKIYPAIGYYPFDKGMRKVYEFAISKNIPLLTHCIEGVVYFRTDVRKDPAFSIHPITKKQTLKGSPSVFQLNFTHPLNYECLLNHDILKTYWGDDAPDLKTLKLCIGHFGGADEWLLFKKQNERMNKSRYKQLRQIAFNPLDLDQPWFGTTGQRLSWLAIIKALLIKYRNLYADISFTLAEDNFHFEELQIILKDPEINRRIIFGTDFYVVSTIMEENKILQLLTDKLSTDEFDMLTKTNPADFLDPAVNYYVTKTPAQ